MSDLRAALILTFEDKVTAGLRRLKEQLDGLKRVGRDLSMGGLKAATNHATGFGRALQAIGGAARTAAGHLKGMLKQAEKLGKSVGPIGALVGFGTLKATSQAYADYDAILRQIAIVEGRSGGGQAARLSGRLGGRFDALALRTGQSSTDIAEAYKWIITTHPGVTADAARAMANQMIGALATAATAYHLNVTDLQNVPFALQSGFGLKGSQMESGLAILHRAAMQAHFTMGAFDQELAGLAAQFGSLGVTGLAGLRSVAAMLETVVKVVPSATPSMAGTDLGDLLSYVTGPMGQARMAMTSRGFSGKMYAQTRALLARAGITHGFNASAIIHAGALTGVDPVDAILNYLHARLKAIPKNITGQDRKTLQGEVINALISNHQAAQAARAILLHWDEYHRTQKAVGGAGKATLDRNFITMHNSPLMQMQIMAEGVRQVGRALGAGFVPVLRAVNFGLLGLVHFLHLANTHFPTATKWVLGLTGAGIALVSVLGVLGFVAPAIAAGFGLLSAPILIAAAAIGGAAYEIYEHWQLVEKLFKNPGRYIHAGIAWLKRELVTFLVWLNHWIATGLAAAVAAIWHTMEAPFLAIEHVLAPARSAATGQLNSAAGGAGGGMSYLMPQLRQPSGHVTVGVDPASGKIHITHAGPPSVVRAQPLDMGDMLGWTGG